ncbi:non-heme iron oxygenase ferredoxin subunit [Candidatus Gottesmanbacteria bacterium]|nr:non-heme iron oxygenase ferredoxin subunit [Candidatus Gottesmanbacteria bacterium]
MAGFIKVISAADLPPGKMRTVNAGSKRLALANVDGQFFAIDDACTHQQCSLGTEGFLDGSTVTCGCHGGQFDITTGKVLALPPGANEETHEVKVENGDVYVKV